MQENKDQPDPLKLKSHDLQRQAVDLDTSHHLTG